MKRVILVLGIVLVVAGCTTQPPPTSQDPGFFPGLLHGMAAPVSFVVSIFDSTVRMYAYPNGGVGYDLGFLFGLLTLWGGGTTAVATKARSDDPSKAR